MNANTLGWLVALEKQPEVEGSALSEEQERFKQWTWKKDASCSNQFLSKNRMFIHQWSSFIQECQYPPWPYAGSLKNPYSGDQILQTHPKIEGFPLFFLHRLDWFLIMTPVDGDVKELYLLYPVMIICISQAAPAAATMASMEPWTAALWRWTDFSLKEMGDFQVLR